MTAAAGVGRADSSAIETARAAARRYLNRHNFPAEALAELDNPPILGPVVFDRNGRAVTAYRWLGAGRGQTYIQVELDADTITAIGACGDAELPPWGEPR